MNKFVILSLLVLSLNASAKGKYDASGNSYYSSGNQVSGYNANTGSTWQSSGTSGTDSRGNTWQRSGGVYSNSTGKTCIGSGQFRTCN